MVNNLLWQFKKLCMISKSLNNKPERLGLIKLRVLVDNVILGEHFEVTPLGNEIISDFYTLNS